jgi:hypothetical protein
VSPRWIFDDHQAILGNHTVSIRCGNEPNQRSRVLVIKGGGVRLVSRQKNERVELEMKILKYRQHAMLAASDDVTRKAIRELISELEAKLAEIDK